MKEFEKWRKENGACGRSYKADARVWRAALEWWLGEGTGGNIRFKDVDVRIELMQEELKEEIEK